MTVENSTSINGAFETLASLCVTGDVALDDPAYTLKRLEQADAIINVRREAKGTLLPADILKRDLFQPVPPQSPDLVNKFLTVAMDVAMIKKTEEEDVQVITMSLRCAYGLLRDNPHIARQDVLIKLVYISLVAKNKPVYSLLSKNLIEMFHNEAAPDDPIRGNIFEALKANARGLKDESTQFRGIKRFALKLDRTYILTEANMETSRAAPPDQKKFKKPKTQNNRRFLGL